MTPTTTSLKPLKLSTRNITVTQIGCHFTGNESKWEVRYVAKSLKRAGRASQKAWADLYLKHPDIIADEYDPVYDVDSPYTLGTIKVYASILSNWPIEERFWDLGISFYQAACPLPKEQRAMVMNRVVVEGLGRDQLRAEVEKLNGGKRPPLPPHKDDIIYDQDRKIYVLENKVTKLETPAPQTATASLSDCDTMVAAIKAAIDELYNTCPDCVRQIRDYVEELE